MTIRNYKKKYFICKDDFGNNLYAGDIVEISIPMELSSTWESEISWSILYGAWVESHPVHKKMSNNPNEQRALYGLIDQPEWRYYEVDEYKTVKGYVKKIKSFNKKD